MHSVHKRAFNYIASIRILNLSISLKIFKNTYKKHFSAKILNKSKIRIKDLIKCAQV